MAPPGKLILQLRVTPPIERTPMKLSGQLTAARFQRQESKMSQIIGTQLSFNRPLGKVAMQQRFAETRMQGKKLNGSRYLENREACRRW